MLRFPSWKIAIILGSTRPNRNGEQVADWVAKQASSRSVTYDLIDLRDHPLPFLDEPVPPSMDDYQNDHTKEWSAVVDQYDGFVFVTPEYNHSTSAALKNAIDYLYREWNDKACAFVGYGSLGGARAIEHLRAIASELQMAHVRQQVRGGVGGGAPAVGAQHGLVVPVEVGVAVTGGAHVRW